jgi:hypothetical protein
MNILYCVVNLISSTTNNTNSRQKGCFRQRRTATCRASQHAVRRRASIGRVENPLRQLRVGSVVVARRALEFVVDAAGDGDSAGRALLQYGSVSAWQDVAQHSGCADADQQADCRVVAIVSATTTTCCSRLAIQPRFLKIEIESSHFSLFQSFSEYSPKIDSTFHLNFTTI